MQNISSKHYQKRRMLKKCHSLPDVSETAQPRYQLRRNRAHQVFERRMEKWVAEFEH